MSLWALRGAILGLGAWLLIQSRAHLDRLCNSLRKRGVVSDQLARSALELPVVLI
jgi:hypothetical protein